MSAIGNARAIIINVKSIVLEYDKTLFCGTAETIPDIIITKLEIKYPRVNEPLSPRNILAGFALNFKKPKVDPIIAAER